MPGLSRLPFSLKVLAENLLRHEDGRTVTKDDIKALVAWLDKRTSDREIAFRPARVLMQDFTGVPAVVDLAAMRNAMTALGGDPDRVNPLVPVDLVIDHSVMVDHFGNAEAFRGTSSANMSATASATSSCAGASRPSTISASCRPAPASATRSTSNIWRRRSGPATRTAGRSPIPIRWSAPTSHTTMINGLSVLGWGVGGIEAEAAMLGQPISMLIPDVVGVRITGQLPEGTTATDLVLTVTQMLRKHGVVGKFVEFFGPGLDHLTLEDRATIANMAPEYGATCGFFPIDGDTIAYLSATGRDADRIALVEAYAKAQGLWRDPSAEPAYTATLRTRPRHRRALARRTEAAAGPRRADRGGDAFAKALHDIRGGRIDPA